MVDKRGPDKLLVVLLLVFVVEDIANIGKSAMVVDLITIYSLINQIVMEFESCFRKLFKYLRNKTSKNMVNGSRLSTNTITNTITYYIVMIVE